VDEEERTRDRILAEDLMGKVEATFELVGQVARDMPEIKERLGRVETILFEHSADLREIKLLVVGHAEAIAELRAVSHEH